MYIYTHEQTKSKLCWYVDVLLCIFCDDKKINKKRKEEKKGKKRMDKKGKVSVHEKKRGDF